SCCSHKCGRELYCNSLVNNELLGSQVYDVAMGPCGDTIRPVQSCGGGDNCSVDPVVDKLKNCREVGTTPCELYCCGSKVDGIIGDGVDVDDIEREPKRISSDGNCSP